MNFWQQRLGVGQTPPTPAPASNQPWWMVGKAAPQAVQPTQPQALQPVQQVAATSVGESHFGDLLRQDGYHTEMAQSARDTERCPDCDSGNYMAPKGHPNAMKQCFECGFNPRFAHSTAGASGIGQQNVAAPRPARVQNVDIGAPQLGTVIGHI